MFSPCLNPVRIQTSKGFQYVPCGRCESCKEHTRKVWARRLEIQSKISPFVLFFTLTYSNRFLPRIYYTSDGYASYFVHSKERSVYNRHDKTFHFLQSTIKDYSISSKFIDVFHEDLKSHVLIAPPHWVRKRNKDKSLVYDNTNSFAVVYQKDFTDFIKRARINMQRFFSRSLSDISDIPTFTYFCASEYGPETFRPHFHGLLFFSSYPKDVDAVLRILTKAWSKSPHNKVGSEFEIVTSKGASAAYVSKYVCKDSSLPPVLQTPEFCTHTSKSISIPLGSESFDISDIPAMFSKGTLLYDECYYDKEFTSFVTYKVNYPLCAWQRVFPQLLGNSLLSSTQLYKVFKRIFSFQSRPSELPNLIKEFPNKYPLNFYKEFVDSSVIEEYRSAYLKNDSSPSFSLVEFFKQCFKFGFKDYRLCTYGDFIDYLICNDLDFYLFGIPQNLTFCRKILRNSLSYEFLSDVNLYYEYFVRYSVLRLTDNLKYSHEYFSELPNPLTFVELYPTFYDSLFPYYYDYDYEQISRLELILSNFDLNLSQFYDDNGFKLSFDADLYSIRAIEEFDLSLKNRSRKTQNLFISSVNYDL